LDEPEVPDLDPITRALRTVVREMEPKLLPGAVAVELVKAFTEVERLAIAGKSMAARQVERCGTWREGSHRTAAHWMAEATGVAVGQAVGTLETARRLEHLPATTRAFTGGELSETKVREVAAAAAAAPGTERELLDAARTDTVACLRRRCLEVKAGRRLTSGRHTTGSTEGGTSGTGPIRKGPSGWRPGSPPTTGPG
jgi:hypothetical protein